MGNSFLYELFALRFESNAGDVQSKSAVFLPMDYKAVTRRARRDETRAFRVAIRRMRKTLGWSQERLALYLGISKRTLSHWECGYWLPPFKQRIHIVVALDAFPSASVLEIADALGVSGNPVVAPMLQRHVDALVNDGEDEEGDGEDESPEPPVEGAATDVIQPAVVASAGALAAASAASEPLRAAIDAIVREAADPMNVAANDLRAALGRVLAECARVGATLEEAQAAVAVRRAGSRRE